MGVVPEAPAFLGSNGIWWEECLPLLFLTAVLFKPILRRAERVL